MERRGIAPAAVVPVFMGGFWRRLPCWTGEYEQDNFDSEVSRTRSAPR
jgi:hypothetical protein